MLLVSWHDRFSLLSLSFFLSWRSGLASSYHVDVVF